jgi:2-oxo-3-hexenedioate decarboxylase/2-keto-4-pentenoate hydratase
MPSGAVLQARRYNHLGLEFEVGVRLGHDLPRDQAPFTREQVAQAVDGVCAAVEVVDDRNADYATLEALSLIADNSWNAGAVLGVQQSGQPEAACGIATVNGRRSIAAWTRRARTSVVPWRVAGEPSCRGGGASPATSC